MRPIYVCLGIFLLVLAACGPKVFQPQEHVVALVSSSEDNGLAFEKHEKIKDFRVYLLYNQHNTPSSDILANVFMGAVKDELAKHGYTMVEQPSQATCIILLDVPFLGTLPAETAERMLNEGYGAKLNLSPSTPNTKAPVVLMADVFIALRTPPERVRRHAPVVLAASKKSILEEGKVRLASMTTEAGFTPNEVLATLAQKIASDLVKSLPKS